LYTKSQGFPFYKWSTYVVLDVGMEWHWVRSYYWTMWGHSGMLLGRGELNSLEKQLLPFYFLHHIFHMNYPGHLWWEADDYCLSYGMSINSLFALSEFTVYVLLDW